MTEKTIQRRYLPSLGVFATFEVTAKHLSFTEAASELHISQAAVSQQIRSLEKALGCQLFHRQHNYVELTPNGRILIRAVTDSLDTLTDAIAKIQGQPDQTHITVAGTHAGTTLFLQPIIDHFKTQYPDLCLTLLTSDENDLLRNFEEVDIALICGDERAEVGETVIDLFPEIVDPVASPDYLATIQGLDLSVPENLNRCDVLELHRLHWSSKAIGWAPLSWEDWFSHHAPQTPTPEPVFVTNCYATLLDTARRGQGLILGWRHLVAEDIKKGRLTTLADYPLATGRSFHLKISQRAKDRPIIKNLVDFLRTTIEGNPWLRHISKDA